jgi:hypothetical protein
MSNETESPKDNGATQAAANPFVMPAAFNESAIAALAQASKSVGQSCADWQHEMQKFAVARMRADMEVPTLLTECENPLDLVKAQQVWFARAAQEYLDEGDRMARMSATVMQQGLDSWLAAFKTAAQQSAPAKVA